MLRWSSITRSGVKSFGGRRGVSDGALARHQAWKTSPGEDKWRWQIETDPSSISKNRRMDMRPYTIGQMQSVLDHWSLVLDATNLPWISHLHLRGNGGRTDTRQSPPGLPLLATVALRRPKVLGRRYGWLVHTSRSRRDRGSLACCSFDDRSAGDGGTRPRMAVVVPSSSLLLL